MSPVIKVIKETIYFLMFVDNKPLCVSSHKIMYNEALPFHQKILVLAAGNK